MFDWEIDAGNPMKYGTVSPEAKMRSDGTGIGGGAGTAWEGYSGHVTFHVEVPDVEAALAKAVVSLMGVSDHQAGLLWVSTQLRPRPSWVGR